jgi:hypothetical protein
VLVYQYNENVWTWTNTKCGCAVLWCSLSGRKEDSYIRSNNFICGLRVTQRKPRLDKLFFSYSLEAVVNIKFMKLFRVYLQVYQVYCGHWTDLESMQHISYFSARRNSIQSYVIMTYINCLTSWIILFSRNWNSFCARNCKLGVHFSVH